MDKKKIVLVCFIAIVIVISGVFLFISRKKKEPSRDYMLFSVNEYLYYPLKSEGKYGVIKKDGTMEILFLIILFWNILRIINLV